MNSHKFRERCGELYPSGSVDGTTDTLYAANEALSAVTMRLV